MCMVTATSFVPFLPHPKLLKNKLQLVHRPVVMPHEVSWRWNRHYVLLTVYENILLLGLLRDVDQFVPI